MFCTKEIEGIIIAEIIALVLLAWGVIRSLQNTYDGVFIKK